VLQLGDEIQIKVKNADLYNRRLEFELVDEDDE
jgi:exoribonuclease R